VLPVLIWAALRGGISAVGLAAVGVAFATNWATLTGRASDFLGTGNEDELLVLVQLFLMVTIVTALVLAVEVAERRRAERARGEAEAAQAESEQSALAAAESERRRIARETHDIVGHALNVILLQAGAARRTLPEDAESTRQRLESIECTR
jgi:signal transduction histidine kinase